MQWHSPPGLFDQIFGAELIKPLAHIGSYAEHPGALLKMPYLAADQGNERKLWVSFWLLAWPFRR